MAAEAGGREINKSACVAGLHGPEHDRVSEAGAQRDGVRADQPLRSVGGEDQPGLAGL